MTLQARVPDAFYDAFERGDTFPDPDPTVTEWQRLGEALEVLAAADADEQSMAKLRRTAESLVLRLVRERLQGDEATARG